MYHSLRLCRSNVKQSKLSATGHVDDVRGKFERLERRTATLEENFEITAKYTALLEKQGVMEKELEESWAGLRTMKDCISSVCPYAIKKIHTMTNDS